MSNTNHDDSKTITTEPTTETPKPARGMRLPARIGVDRFDVEPDEANLSEGDK